MFKSFLAGGLMLAATVLAVPAGAQTAYPDKPVTVLVPFTAGGTADIFARMIADHLSKTWGQPFVVENIGGGGGVIALQRLARSTPDGATIAIASTSNLAIHPTLMGEKVGYETLRDMTPVIQVSVVPNVLVANPERIKAKTVAELAAYVKENPEKVAFGSAGNGTTQHLAGELFQQSTGTKMTHVPYKGSSQMLPDLLGGRIDIAFDNAPLLLPQVKAGKLVALATATPERAAFDPNLPTVAETVPGFQAVAWHGFLTPKGTPRPIVDKLAGEIRTFMQRPETQQKFSELGALPVATSPEEFAKLIASETERWKKVIQTANIKPE
jgi:tripartite-type tricarboxylate transporter receptor subunit TctC